MSNPPLVRPADPSKENGAKEKRGAWLSCLLVFIVGSVLAVILVFLSLGVFLNVLVIGGVLFAITGFHYFVWGWWLGEALRKSHELDEDET